MNPLFSLPSSKSLAKSPDAALLNLTIVGVGVFGLGMLGFVLIRAFSPLELNFNEGWNGYHQLAAQRGENVYPPSSALYFNNYPPLSFLLVGYVGRLGLDVVLVGRLISTLSVLATAIFCGVTLSNLTDRTWPTTAVGASICLAALCVASPGYVGVNDPQFLAHALMTAALAAYTRSADGSLKSTVVLMALAGMTKHNILAAPLAVAADTLHRSPIKFWRFVALSVVALSACSIWLHFVSDGRIWASLLSPRAFSYVHAIEVAKAFAKIVFVMLLFGALGVMGGLREWPSRFVFTYGVTSLLVGAAASNGEGTWLNMYFDLVIASSLGVGILIVKLQKDSSGEFLGVRYRCLAALFLAAAIVGPTLANGGFIRGYIADPILEQSTRDDIAYLQSRPGAALCAQALLCLRANKVFVYDVFNAAQAIKVGRLPIEHVQRIIAGLELQTLQLSDEDAAWLAGRGVRRTPSELLQVLLPEIRRSFRIDRESGKRAFFVRIAPSAKANPG